MKSPGDEGLAAIAGTLLAAAEAARSAAAGRDPWLSELPIAGIGWASVELDRAACELASITAFEAV